MFPKELYNTAFLILKRSKLFSEERKPKEDIVTYLHIEIGEARQTMHYKILEPDKAEYDKVFEVAVDFFNFSFAKENIKLNKEYKVYRGIEEIGTVNFRKEIEPGKINLHL